MSITSEEYFNWCDAVSNTNRAVVELMQHRKKNYRWMEKHLREFFEQLGTVITIHFESDAHEITIRMEGDEVQLDSELLNSLPFTFTIHENLQDIVFALKPQISSVKELSEVYED